jgi:outer membrane usher protein
MSPQKDAAARCLGPTEHRRLLLSALILSGLASPAYGAAPASPAGPASPASPVAPTGAEPVTFESSFFPSGSGISVDLSRFDRAGYVPAGTYRGDVSLNNQWRARTDIVFEDVAGTNATAPCYDAAALTRYGIDLHKVATDAAHPARKQIPDGTFCGNIGDYIPDAAASFDASDQSLSLSVPQIYTLRNARGYVDPSQWDSGINAGVLSYNSNFYRSSSYGATSSTAYLGLNGSLNFGSWHLNHLGSLNWSSRLGKRYQNNATYLQHDIPAWQAQAVAGDTFTSGNFFDSVRVRGVSLYTDDRMLPQSLRGYAPVVRGIADTNAHVVIRQNGYIIYDTTVAPGPFVIDDLYPTGYGGDLDVEVTEADGRVRRFSQPYAAVAQLLRPGQQRWSFTAGKVKQASLLDGPTIVQGTYQRGLNNLFTGYTGAIIGSGYRSALIGTALNTDAGAFSTDLTYANNSLPGRSSTSGLSMRLGYNKVLSDTGTTLNLGAYRYSTSGFVGLSDAVAMRDAVARDYSSPLLRQRNRFDLTLNQPLGDRSQYGQFYLTGSMINYWNGSGRQVNYSAGYSNNWKQLSYSISAQRTTQSVASFGPGVGPVFATIPGASDAYIPSSQPTIRDTQVFVNFSLPLGRADKAPLFSSSVNHSSSTGTSSQASLSGRLGNDNRISYGASLGRNGDTTNAALNAQYIGSMGNVGGTYSYSTGYHAGSLGLSGTVVAHRDGVTFSPPAGDTIGLVHAPGAAGAQLSGIQGAAVDKNGYAIVPNLMPYLLNTVTLDPKGTGANVEFKDTSQNVAPRAGTVVRLNYHVDSSTMLLIDAKLNDGRAIPFGADVLDEHGKNVGVAGQASRLMVRGIDADTTLIVRWGAGEGDSCRLPVKLPAGKPSDVETIHAVCEGRVPAGAARMGQANASQTPTAQAESISTHQDHDPSASTKADERHPNVYGALLKGRIQG